MSFRPERRSTWARLGIAAAIVLVIAASALAIVQRDRTGDGTQSVRAADGLTPTPDFAGRFYPAVAWTGKGVFVFGGQAADTTDVSLLSDAAVLTPGSGDVQMLPDSGLGPLFEPDAIRVGNQMLVVGPACDEILQPEGGETGGCKPGTYRAALFDLSSDDWRSVAVPARLQDRYRSWWPGDYRRTQALGLAPDGNAVFALGALGAEEYWTYSSGSDTWTQLPAPGVRSDAQCLAGDNLVVLNSQYQYHGAVQADDPSTAQKPGESLSFGPDDGFVLPRIAVLDLRAAKEWTTGEALTDDLFDDSAPPSLACLNNSVLVSDAVATTNMHLYDLQTGHWRAPSVPPGANSFPPIPPMGSRVWTGKELVFLPTEEIGASAVAYAPSTDTWRTLTDLPPVTRMAVWSGSTIVGYGEPLLIVELPDLSHGLPDSRPDPPREQIATSGVFEYAPPK
ncbi:MAG: hypothetical protein WD271_14795 [Acidimicrobiia bacterium]